MHIPDGYLSPSTCAALYGAALPFWVIALKRLKKVLNTKTIPLLSVFAAFSFVIMMFNLPLPGGTTGHAVGMGIATVVLGPWASMIAVSVALFIQALFFGDGGITAIGANCFNMAIIGSLAAAAVYRVAGAGSEIGSRRRVWAAGLAGYLGINAAALCAAIEFGIQPLLFHDSAGTPLYCPYPLKVSVPAMMLGHLTFAGLAEFVISAGVVAYLQKADAGLLRQGVPRTGRLLWLALAVLIVLSPLGMLAVGSAWGEWTPQEVAAATGKPVAPAGMAQLAGVWDAPLARYAPSFVGNAAVGYVLSALAGVGFICLAGFGLRYSGLLGGSRRRRSFLEKTIRSLLEISEQALFAERKAGSRGWLQAMDARTKLAGLGALLLAALVSRRLTIVAAVFVLGVVLAAGSRVAVHKVWFAVLGFTGVIAIPALFLTPGIALMRLPLLGWPVTEQGLRSAALLVLRAETAATLTALLVFTTVWTRLLRALRFFRMPVIVVVIFGMTYRYIFLFLQTARDMFESRETRIVGTLAGSEQRRLAGGSAGVLLGKTIQLSGDVHLAMQARGFRGEVYLLDEPRMGLRDWLPLAGLAVAAGACIWMGQ